MIGTELEGISPSNSIMKTLTINGVPYLINEQNEAFVYASVPPIPIGSYNPDTKVLTLADDWQERMADWMAHYRQSLKEATGEALEKAKELQAAT